MSIEISAMGKTETAWEKSINFTYQGQDYFDNLLWDNHNGYDLDFPECPAPEWYLIWEDNNENSLASTLDELSEKILEESYL